MNLPPRLLTVLSVSLAVAAGTSLDAREAAAPCAGKPEVRLLHWAWNAQMGALYANGGAVSTPDSLVCARGVNLKFVRQDDVGRMQESLVAFATALKKGEAQPKDGAHFVVIMGDGAGAFLAPVNTTLARLGPEYTAKVVGALGYSRGEDRFMGPAAWKASPAAAKGGVVSGVLRDGDWNIALKWLGDHKLCNNPNEKTYDPECLNWVAASDYLDAAEKYVAGYCEDRPVVKKGQRTGETKKACVGGVVTWTPGDVNVATKKGGLVSIVSTKENASQMPAVLIGIDAWMKANRPTVEGLLEAFAEGGSRVKASDRAMQRAAEISAAVYKEADAAYWLKYAKGITEKDKQGLTVELGGSSVSDLRDMVDTFGLGPGTRNLFGITYKTFGDIVVAQYPDLVPSYPPLASILDTSYLQAVAKRAGIVN